MATKMAPSRYAHDSDSDDLPELDALINKHVKGLPALDAPNLMASKITAPRLVPRKTVEKTTRLKSDTTNTNAPTKRSTRSKTASQPLTELKSAPEVRRSGTEPKLQPRGQAALKELEKKMRESKSRDTRAKPASRRLPRVEDSESEESYEEVEEQDVEESIHCESDGEDSVLAPRAVNKPRRRLVAGRRSPDLDSSDSDEDVFHTPPSKQSQRPVKESFTTKASDDLTQKLLQLDLDGSDKENDNLAILKL